MRLSKKLACGLRVVAALFSFNASAQLYPPAPVEPGYFMFPIMPGQQNFLSGSMGEIRPNHFHGGIDIKTNQQTGLPVYAAADGYISRIEVSSYGYGWQLYVTHPNGLSTSYAHLESFAPAIADFVLKKQYEKESFDLRLNLPPDQFPVKKGEVIGRSGNTGGSGGPHLHFEVRDERNRLQNPLKYGFAEIKDDIAPTFQAIALKTLSIDARVNQRFGRFEYLPQKKGAVYVLPDTLTAHGLIGLEVQAYDRYTGAANKNGVQQVDVQLDGKPFYTHLIDGVPFELTKQVSWHINYEFFKGTGRNFQKCYVDDGNLLPLYTTTGSTRGKLFIQPGAVHQVSMTLKDSYNNTTTLQFVVKGEAPAFFATRNATIKKPDISYEIAENLLKVVTADTARQATPIQLFVNKMKYDLVPSYTQASNTVYLYDLRGGLPDSMTWNGFVRQFNLQQAIPAGTEYTFANRFMNISFDKGSLFDTLYLNTGYNKGVYWINSPLTPIFQPLKVTLKAENIADKSRAHVYYLGWGKGAAFLGGTWHGDQITFQARNLGQYKVLSDTKAPTVQLVAKTPQEIRLKIGDNLSGVATYRAELNGKFLLLKYEHKLALLYSERLDPATPLRGDLVVRLTDAAGNENVFRTRL